MHPSQIIRLLNSVLKRINSAVQLPSDTAENQIEPQLNMMLGMFDKLADVKRSSNKRAPVDPPHFQLRLAKSKRRVPAGASRVKSFCSALESAGVTPQQALSQAVRLGVGGATNDR